MCPDCRRGFRPFAMVEIASMFGSFINAGAKGRIQIDAPAVIPRPKPGDCQIMVDRPR